MEIRVIWKAAWGRGDLISEETQRGRVESITTGFIHTHTEVTSCTSVQLSE